MKDANNPKCELLMSLFPMATPSCFQIGPARLRVKSAILCLDMNVFVIVLQEKISV